MTLEHDIRRLHPSWQVALNPFITSPEGEAVLSHLDGLLQRDAGNYHPRRANIFRAFRKTLFNNAKVIIIGQDPYLKPDEATGLAFSLPPREPDQNPLWSPSINIIYNAIETDNRIRKKGDRPEDGNLIPWAEQGVLLLNRVLTFRKCKFNCCGNCKVNVHKHQGWEIFTKAVVKALSDDTTIKRHFMLWGEDAHKLDDDDNIIINTRHHRVHRAAHPTARENVINNPRLEDSKHFSDVNDLIRSGIGKTPEIIWFPRAPAVPVVDE